MKIYDISQEVFDCNVFPGDPKPIRKVLMNMDDGAICNLTEITMCAHNGTHIDAPYHFCNDGKTVDEVPLDKVVGPCYVYTRNGELGADEVRKVYELAKSIDAECAMRLLFKGSTVVTLEAAKVMAELHIKLVGNESQTVGPEDAPAEVHRVLLPEEIVLLEGIRLADVPDGRYILNAAPINLGGADGAPCRAILYED